MKLKIDDKIMEFSEGDIKFTLEVKLSDGELYELELPNPINLKEIPNVVAKLNKLSKLVPDETYDETDETNETNGNVIKKFKKPHYGGRGKTRLWCNTREKAIAVMCLSFHGTRKEKDTFAKNNNILWLEVVKAFHNLRIRYNIKPHEIGLKVFLKRGSNRSPSYLNSIKLPNFVYTAEWRNIK